MSAIALESDKMENIRDSIQRIGTKIDRRIKGERLLVQRLELDTTNISEDQADNLTAMLCYHLVGKKYRLVYDHLEIPGELKTVLIKDLETTTSKNEADTLLLLKFKDNSNGINLSYSIYRKGRKGLFSNSKGECSLTVTNDQKITILKSLPTHNNNFLKFAILNHGKKVGNGQCWTLAEHARKAAGIKRRNLRDWGKAVDQSIILPGDVLEINRGKEIGHTAIVYSVQGKKVLYLHQNAGPYRKELAVGISGVSKNKNEKFVWHRPGLEW